MIHALSDEGHLAEYRGRLEFSDDQLVLARDSESLHPSCFGEKQALACVAGPEEHVAGTVLAHSAGVL